MASCEGEECLIVYYRTEDSEYTQSKGLLIYYWKNWTNNWNIYVWRIKLRTILGDKKLGGLQCALEHCQHAGIKVAQYILWVLEWGDIFDRSRKTIRTTGTQHLMPSGSADYALMTRQSISNHGRGWVPGFVLPFSVCCTHWSNLISIVSPAGLGAWIRIAFLCLLPPLV